MELDSEHPAFPGRRSETDPVLGGREVVPGGGGVRIERMEEVGVPAFGDPPKQGAPVDLLELIPADVRYRQTAPEPADAPRQQAQPGNAGCFIAVGKEHLETDTNAEQPGSGFNGLTERRLEAAFAKGAHRFTEMPVPRQNEPFRVRDAFGIGREVHVGPLAPECPDHAAEVSGPVVHDHGFGDRAPAHTTHGLSVGERALG